MKTPAQFNREPGKLPTPPLCPGPSATPGGILTTNYADFSDRMFLATSSARVFASFGAKAELVAPRSPQFGTFPTSDFGFVSDFEFRISDLSRQSDATADFRLCRAVKSMAKEQPPIRVHWCSFVVTPGFCCTVVAPNCGKLHQIAVNCASRPGPRLLPSQPSTLNSQPFPVTSGHPPRLLLFVPTPLTMSNLPAQRP